MGKSISKGFVFVLVLMMSIGNIGIFSALASHPEDGETKTKVDTSKADVEIMVQVNEKGFMDHKNKFFGRKNPLKIPKGKVVRITFVFAESVTSLAYGDTHQVTIASKKGWSRESEKIWMFHQKTSVTFVAGEDGSTQYRAYCILDCIGMDKLKNLVIKVV